MSEKVNLKNWKEKHPKLSAIAEIVPGDKEKEYGTILLKSNNPEALERQYHLCYKNDSRYVFVK